MATFALHGMFAVLAWSALGEGPRPSPLVVDASSPAVLFVQPTPVKPRTASALAQPLVGIADAAAYSAAAGRLAKAAVEPDAPLQRAADGYVSGQVLEIGPQPAGVPNFSWAKGLSRQTVTVVLRVYVSKFGPPDRVELRGALRPDEFTQALQHALEQTTFLPGRLAGHDVASFVDYEFRARGATELHLNRSPDAS